jgi:hypothetical protein
MSFNSVCEYSKLSLLLAFYLLFFYTMVTTLGFGWSSPPSANISKNPAICNKYKPPNKVACLSVLDEAFRQAQHQCADYVSLLDKCQSVNTHTCGRDRSNVDACYNQVMDAVIRGNIKLGGVAT